MFFYSSFLLSLFSWPPFLLQPSRIVHYPFLSIPFDQSPLFNPIHPVPSTNPSHYPFFFIFILRVVLSLECLPPLSVSYFLFTPLLRCRTRFHGKLSECSDVCFVLISVRFTDISPRIIASVCFANGCSIVEYYHVISSYASCCYWRQSLLPS